MEMASLLYVALGGAIGAVLRHVTAITFNKAYGGGFPLAIMVVNIAGSFLMGCWIGTMATLTPERTKDLHLLVAVGVLGGFTTFSTFSLESWMLVEKGLYAQAAGYICGSVILSVAALFAGLWILRTLTP